MEAVEDSLRRLSTDHIDLYQHHFFDESTPQEETIGTLDELVRAGKVLAIGCSNYDGKQIEEAETIATAHGWAHYATAQNHYSLLERREVERVGDAGVRSPGHGHPAVLPAGERPAHRQVPPRRATTARQPARQQRQRAGELMTDANFDIVEALERFARERGVALLDVAIGGLAALPQVVSVIAGATSPEQVAANARAGRWTPTSADAEEIERITVRTAVA